MLAAKRLIANFLEVRSVHRCAEHVISRQTAGAGQRGGGWVGGKGGCFQTSFVTSFQHHLQNGGWMIDGQRGLFDMRDWYDAQSALFVVFAGGMMAHVLEQLDLRQKHSFQ